MSTIQRHIKVEWIHDRQDDPVVMFSEVDGQMWETRKVEVYKDGRAGYAWGDAGVGGTKLSIEPLPPLCDIEEDPQFQLSVISRDEFESIWSRYAC